MTIQKTTALQIREPGAPGLARRLGARLLRAIAGSTAAVQRQSRRGSFLVIVVGTLALMSVFAIIYIAIGQGDVGQKVGLQRNIARDDIPNQFADYVAQIIADNAVALAPAGEDIDPKTSLADQLTRRQTWDYPGTPFVTSDGSGTLKPYTDKEFDPTGHGTNPFLAATEPVDAGLNSLATPAEWYLRSTDWLHISNVAPDGRFVNLATLRDFDPKSGPIQFDTSTSNLDKRNATLLKPLRLLDDKGVPIANLPYGGAAVGNITAHWDSYQRGLFRPAKDSDRTPGNQDYLLNSYADADGDGMLDSRWFELATTVNPNNPGDKTYFKSFLDASDRYRFFFATRIVDLSGLVNFTTATDFVEGPSKDAPVGARPSEVDVRRLLSLEDVYRLPLGIGYHMLMQTAKLTDPDNYSGYDQAMAANVGAHAYDALHRAITTGHIPVTPTSAGPTPFVYTDPIARADLYSNLTGAAGTLAYDSVNARYELSNLFGAPDFLDLLTYRACNNPDISSAIEDITGGRYWGKSGEAQRYSPLRDNRGFDLELADRDPLNKGIADPASMIFFATDIRHLITPFSGARPLRSTIVGAGVTTLTGTEVKIAPATDAAAAFHAYADALIPDSANTPIGIKPNVITWPNSTDDVEYQKIKFAHYGYTTPELGLRLSAHMAANFVQAVNGGQSAKPYTLLVDETFRTTGDTSFPNIKGLNQDYKKGVNNQYQYPKDMAQRQNLWSWWADNGSGLDLGDNSLPVNVTNRTKSRLADKQLKTSTVSSPAINVYAIVPEPVITAVACYTVYTDAPKSLPGTDDDSTNNGFDGNGDPVGLCTIRGTVDTANSDFLMQVLAFQLSNPFDVGIDLSFGIGPLTKQDRFEYYIEYNGRAYRLADLGMQTNPTGAADLQGATLGPGQTRVFFATSQSIAEIQKRWDKIPAKLSDGTDVQTEAIVTNWLKQQFKEQLGFGNAVGDPVWIEEMKFVGAGKGYNAQRVKYSATMNPGGFNDLNPPALPNHPPGTTDVVRLWRALRTQNVDPTSTAADATETNKVANDPLPPQYLENDQLVDRLRDPSATGQTLVVSMPPPNFKIKDATAYAETNTSANNYNHGLTIARYGVIHRPSTPGFGNSRFGALPAYMLEKKWAPTSASLNRADLSPPGTDINNYTSGTTGAVTFGEFVQKFATGNSQIIPDFGKDVAKYTLNMPPPNKSGVGFDKLMIELAKGLKTDTLRLADTLLPLAVGPEFVPVRAPTDVTDPIKFDQQHLTLEEALALALDYDRATIADDPYVDLAITNAPTNPPKIDRGHLVLDDFAPFYDENGDKAFTIGPASKDQRRGLGIPLALGVLDTFRALPAQYGSLTRSTAGLININTAPLSVLRTIPMLSPSTVNWWGTPSASKFAHDATSDIAATVAAYRDKVDIDFRPSLTAGLKNADYHEATAKPNQPDLMDARNINTGVGGIREAPGFHSVGEIMLARLSTAGDPSSIDYLGFNNRNDSLAGVNSINYTPVGASPTVNAISDDYEEKLMIANAALNSLSVRSDVFAVWFLVHGYQKSDAQRADGQPLTDTDPLVPSIQRRFLMIVDRSNVTTKGQKPRIVLLKEIPL